MPLDQIVIRGANEHNLKNIDVEIPRDKLVVFTGISGSGKSSLAFDTIYAEGQRRYVESLSAYARQFLGQMEKPDVEHIEGLSPAISIDQKTASRNPRSTVGTVTEIHDYLRLMYARIGVPHCPECGSVVARQTAQQIADKVLELERGTKFQLLAPVVEGRKGQFENFLADLNKDGFSRARIDGQVRDLSEPIQLDRYFTHTIEVVVDRLAVQQDMAQRLAESLDIALKLSHGAVLIDIIDGGEVRFSQAFACPNGHASFEELQPRNFSFNSPYGACDACFGIGTSYQVDPHLLVPDPDKTLEEGAIAPWSGHKGRYYQRLLAAVAGRVGFSMETPFTELDAGTRELLMTGTGDEVIDVSYLNRFGRKREYQTQFEGAVPFITRRYSDTDSDSARMYYQQYMREVPCDTCHGACLNPVSMGVTVAGRSLHELNSMPLTEAHAFVRDLSLSERDMVVAEAVTKEVGERLKFLLDVGLSYLNLSRGAATLSGGEAQRIRLATQIGSGLVGVLYILDEPSIGLHQRDNQRLLETLLRLRDLGNTLIVVEHDEETIRIADHVIDIGPGAGEHGGEIVAQGTPADIEASDESLTGDYLSGRRVIPTPSSRRSGRGEVIEVIGARQNNLQNLDVSFPLGKFISVTGVSGSGKSSLVQEILSKGLHATVARSRVVPGRHKTIEGIEHIDKVINIDQSPIGRTPRSNPATYTNIFDKVRALYASLPESKARGYKPGRFSFNVKGGRCEVCKGDGTIKIEMHFLPDVYVPCEECRGKRYNRETLTILFKGKSISDVLHMPITDALEFFAAHTPIARILQTLHDVGLGYVRLGQPAPTLSGGEAQRVKLASELGRRATGRTFYILDEPTTGLHFEDIRKLLGVLQRLTDTGNTVVVIEHNLDVIKSTDHVIDIGPEGGANGGLIMAEGTPEEVAKVESSYTGHYLSRVL